MYLKKFGTVLISLVLVGVLFSPVFADHGTLNGDGISISADETEIKKDEPELDENGDPIIPEIEGEIGEDGYVVNLKMPTVDEFRVVVADECDFIEKITFKTRNELTGQLRVVKLEENPSSEELENSVGFCNLELIDVEESDIENVSFKLRIGRDELNENKYGKDSMTIFVLEDGKWQNIKTKRIDGDVDYYYYTAEVDNIGEGIFGFASKPPGILTITNALFCLGAVVGFAVLLGLGYFLVTRPAPASAKSKKESK